jgi:glycosyltransferase involved in cell wall biosynthesis
MNVANVKNRNPHIAVFLPTLEGGGAEKVMVNLINGFCGRGYDVDVVLAQARGAYLAQLPPQARIVDLQVTRVLYALKPLVKYLRSARPVAMISAMDHCNVIALLAKRLAGTATRMVISVHSNFTMNNAKSGSVVASLARFWVRPFYHRADRIVAVSTGVADDLCASLSLPRQQVQVIHNPVVTPELYRLAAEPVDHPWFGCADVPVILGVGRLNSAKAFDTLIRAFSLIRQQIPARLLILGEGEDRASLESLVQQLGLQQDVQLPGFVANPFAYMRVCSLFVLSSRWEGFGNVLAEALACGARVISTDCPSGPAEILANGRFGRLVPVDDAAALADGVITSLRSGERIDAAAASERFVEEKIVDRYLEVLVQEPERRLKASQSTVQ